MLFIIVDISVYHQKRGRTDEKNTEQYNRIYHYLIAYIRYFYCNIAIFRRENQPE